MNDKDLERLISPEQIQQKINEVAHVLDKDFQDKKLTIVMIMKGAFCITADLIRKLHIPFTIEYIRASSYGEGGIIPSKINLQGIEDLNIRTKDVLLIDDILDQGITLKTVMKELEAKNPRSLKTLVLLKKILPKKSDYRPDYVLFEIEDRFVVGYGLDYKEYYRGLPGIYAFINNQPPTID